MHDLVDEIIQENKYVLHEVSQAIWSKPELAFKEKHAHKVLTGVLEQYGFEVQKQYVLPTAFRARYTNGNTGPTIAVLCEYDALPNIGHACGHNLIAEIGLAVGIALKAAMKKNPTIGGTVVVLGTPAEEAGGGKIHLIEAGVFDDIDVAMMAHPQVNNRLFPLVLELKRGTVMFKTKTGVDPLEHSNAMDATITFYNSISIMRRTMDSKWRIHVIISNSSREEAELSFTYRAPNQKDLIIIEKKLTICIMAAGNLTNCQYQIDFQKDTSKNYKGMITNRKMAEIFARYAEEKGITFKDNDNRCCESAVSTDMGNVSHVVPSIQPEYSIGAFPHVNHTLGFADVAGSLEAQEQTLIVAGALAKSALDLLTDPDLMAEVKKELSLNRIA